MLSLNEATLLVNEWAVAGLGRNEVVFVWAERLQRWVTFPPHSRYVQFAAGYCDFPEVLMLVPDERIPLLRSLLIMHAEKDLYLATATTEEEPQQKNRALDAVATL